MACSTLSHEPSWDWSYFRAALPNTSYNSSFQSQASSALYSEPPFPSPSPVETEATQFEDEFFVGKSMEPYPRRERSPGGMRVGARSDYDDYRGRRSPGIHARRPGRDYVPPRRADYRRRSPQRNDIDRYMPGQDSGSEAPIINPLMDPMKLESQVGFSYFAEWWRKEQEKKDQNERQKTGRRAPPPRAKSDQEMREEREKEHAKIQLAYDQYKEKLAVTTAKAFVHQHKDEEWFKERYDPDIRSRFRQAQASLRRENFARWAEDVDNGVFDDFTLEGIYKNDSNGAGGVVEKEEGETIAVNETLGVGDLVPMKGGELPDPQVEQPSLLIKTIAPHVGRERIEDFCKEHLGEGDGGFKWLSLSDPNPQKKFHRIGWIILNSGSDVEVSAENEQNQDADQQAMKEDDGDDEETKMEEVTRPSTKMIPAQEKALRDINGKMIEIEGAEKGGFTCHVGIHTPPGQTRKKALWDLFSAPERIERELQLVERIAAKFEQELGEDINGVNKVEERVEEMRSKGQLQPTSNGAGIKTKAEDGDDDEDEGMVDDDEGTWDEDADDEDLLTKKKKLDLLVEYMRRVHHFCFFCVFESDSVHEIMRKCPGGHLRRPRATLTTAAKSVAKASAFGEEFPLKKQTQHDQAADDAREEGESPTGEKPQRFQKNNKTHVQLQRAYNWVKTYEDKLFQILEPEAADLVKLGGRPLDDALEEELKKFVKQEDEAKFRCKVPDCAKLFKGENFWRKHVEKRHAEWYETLRKELNEINLYVLDPAHLQPARSDATSNGHFSTNSHGPGGTPRGFSLQNMGMPMQAGFMNSMSAFGGMPLMGMSGTGLDGGAGPSRRMGGRYAQRSGPYDRSGRLGGGGRRPGGGNRGGPPPQGFPDAAPPGTTPHEATVGRSLKSYEDLDAVGGPTGAATNRGAGGSSGAGDAQLDY
ncbi:MAG: hypothetical protein Q9159_001842 [Coniocarpon cinnabarinum]